MSDPWPVTVVPAVVSGVGAVVTVVAGRRAVMRDRREATDQLAVRFTEPLLQASFNLQTRIYNIVELDFFAKFHHAGSTAEEREYAELNTLYVTAQYFCWIEILRRASQFSDPRNDRRNIPVARGLEAVRDTFANSQTIAEDCFRLFRGEQRALGEIMLVAIPNPEPGSPRWECLGYAPFVAALDDPAFARWFRKLRSDVEVLCHDAQGRSARLRLIQRRLLDVIDALDPDGRRIPVPWREKVGGPVAPTSTPARRREAARDA